MTAQTNIRTLKVAILLLAAVSVLLYYWQRSKLHMFYHFEVDVNSWNPRGEVLSSGFRNPPPTYRSADDNCKPLAKRNVTAPAISTRSRVGIEISRQIASGGYAKIQPGSGPVSFVGLFVTVLSKVQHDRGLFGSVGELGVHHGHFTIVLYITARSTEKLVAADIFMQQAKNQDGSGKGDLDRFIAALKTIGLDKADLAELHVGSTTELPFDWHERQGFEPFRMVSIDAGHTATLTFNDLEVTACSTMPGGIIILDDFLHPDWTGVTEGWYRHLSQGHDKLYAFLFCEGKLFATNEPDAHMTYYESLLNDKHVGKYVFRSAERRGGSRSLEINGVSYLSCDGAGQNDKHIGKLWRDLAY